MRVHQFNFRFWF